MKHRRHDGGQDLKDHTWSHCASKGRAVRQPSPRGEGPGSAFQYSSHWRLISGGLAVQIPRSLTLLDSQVETAR